MKSIGLIGGMSWESTALYYQLINREVARRCGGLVSADLHLRSLNFDTVARLQQAGEWAQLADLLADAAVGLERMGARAVLLCTNTMHRVAPQVQQRLGIPLVHIADVTGRAVLQSGLHTVALLGTRFTMEQGFYVDHLAQQGVQALVPPPAQREQVHRIIYEELCQGQVREDSRRALLGIVVALQASGAQGLVLGCTELSMILGDQDLGVPVFDTTALHALAAVDFALEVAPAHG